MATEYKGLYVKFEGDTTSLSSALAKIGTQSRSAQRSLKMVQQAAKMDARNPKLLADAIGAAKDKAEAAAKKFDVLRQAEEQMAAAGDTSSEAFRRISRQADAAEASLRATQRTLLGFQAAATPLGQAATRLSDFGDKAKSVGSKLSGVGGALTVGVTAPIAAAAVASVKAATDVDTSLTNVRKTTDMTNEGYEALKRGAIELSKVQPVPATTILDMEALGAQLGWSNDQLQDFAQVVSGLDIATDMDAATAATNLAQFANVTGMAQDQAQNYASAIVGLGNNMATTESKISDMAQGMASAGTQAGMSQADILGFAAATASLGMEAQAGGTAFSKTITEIGTQVSTNGKQLEQWASLAGMSVDEFKQAWGSDVTGTFERVIQGMAGVQDGGGDLNVTLSDLGITETRQSDFLRRLAGSADLVTRAVGLSNDEWDKNTALTREVDNRNQSVAAKMQVLKNRVEAVAAEVGGPLIDAAADALEAAEPLFRSIEDGARAFSSMSKGEQLAIIKAVVFAAAVGPCVKALGSLAGGIGSLSKGASRVLGSLSVLQAGFTATDAATLESARSVGGLAGKLGALGNPLTRASGDLTAFQKGLSLVATGADSLLVMLPALAAGLAIGAVATAGAEALVRYANGYDEASRKSRESVEACDAWAKAQQGVQAAVVETSAAFSDSGQSAATIQDGVSESMRTITSTIETETSQWGHLTEEGVQAIKDALAKLNESQEHVSSAFGNAMEAIQQRFGHLDASSVVQYTKDVQGAFDQGKQQLDSTLDQELQAIEAYHTQVGDVGSAAYASDVQAAKDAYSRSLQALEQHRDEAVAKTSEMYGDLDQATVDGWRQIDEATNGVKTPFQKWLNNDRSGSGVAIATTKANFERLRATIDEGATGAWMAAQAATISAGGQLSAASNDNVRMILDTFDDLPDSLKEEGTDSMRALAEAVEASGVDLGDVGSMSAQELVDRMREVFGQVPEDANASVDQIAEAFARLTGIKLEPKSFTVTDDGTIEDEAGRVWDLNARTIDGKHFTVNDDGTISIEDTNVDHLDANQIAKKDFTVTDNRTAQQAESAVDRVQRDNIDNKSFTVSVDDNATSVLQGIKGWVDSLHDKVISVFTQHVDQNAAGGIVGSGLRYHADGFIAATPTFISSHDVVGEAGAEAVIPLTNRRYVTPFADTVADGIVSKMPDYSKAMEPVVGLLQALVNGQNQGGVYLDGDALVGELAASVATGGRMWGR